MLEWTLDAFDHKSCERESFFFNEIMTSICYAAKADYENAGDCWRSAFYSIEKAIDREDPELLVALMWSVTLLDRLGCGDVVVMLQNYLLHLLCIRAKSADPLFPVLASFARIHPTKMLWLREIILNMILDWATDLSREDLSLFKVYSWSLLPGADGVMSIALTSFMDFKSGAGNDKGLVGQRGTDHVGQRLIFMARTKK